MRLKLFVSVIICILLVESCQRSSRGEVEIGNRVLDRAKLLSQEQREHLFDLITQLEQSVGSQIAIITVDSLNGERIEDFSLAMLEQLKLGRENFKDGLLIVVADKDHEVRIEVGYGLEKIIRDEIARRINREEMIPKFKEHKFYEGLYLGVSRIKKLIEDNKHLVGQLP